MTDWKQDAQFVGAFIRGGSWEIGLRIARNVTVDTGNGGKSADKSALVNRVSLRTFATEAGIDGKTVARYLSTWEWAADAGLVDRSAELTSDFEYDWPASELTQETWNNFFEVAGENPPFWNPQGKPMKPRKKDGHVSRKEVETAIKKAVRGQLPEDVIPALRQVERDVSLARAGAEVAADKVRHSREMDEALEKIASGGTVEKSPDERDVLVRSQAEIDRINAAKVVDPMELLIVLQGISEDLEERTTALTKFVLGGKEPQAMLKKVNDHVSAAYWNLQSLIKD